MTRGASLTRCAAALVAIAAALLLAACGDGETEARTVTTTRTVTAPVTTGATSVTTEAESALPPADETVTELTGFTSPTGNIGCYIDREGVRCDIAERAWTPPPAPDDCDLDYGQGIALGAGGAGFVCAGDTALNAGPPLEWGRSIAAGPLRCESEKSGMTCRNEETRAGFTLSRQAYALF